MLHHAGGAEGLAISLWGGIGLVQPNVSASLWALSSVSLRNTAVMTFVHHHPRDSKTPELRNIP